MKQAAFSLPGACFLMSNGVKGCLYVRNYICKVPDSYKLTKAYYNLVCIVFLLSDKIKAPEFIELAL